MTAPDAAIPAPRSLPGLARSLATWRRLRRIKQGHVAELCGVSQATVSRWEAGLQVPTEAQAGRLRRMMAARPDSAADHALLRLVRQSAGEAHLVCDLTHRLLAASPAREARWRASARDLAGVSLWRFASAEIMAAERRLEELGWFAPAAPAIRVATGPNASPVVPIRPGAFTWTRLQLSDGSFVRLVETEDAGGAPAGGPSAQGTG